MLDRNYFAGGGLFLISEFSSMFRCFIALGLRCQKTSWQEEYIDETVHVSQEEVERRGQDKVFACEDISAVTYFLQLDSMFYSIQNFTKYNHMLGKES